MALSAEMLKDSFPASCGRTRLPFREELWEGSGGPSGLACVLTRLANSSRSKPDSPGFLCFVPCPY